MNANKKSIYRGFAFLLTLTTVLHFTNLTHPNCVVFDEVHFGEFSSAYCCDHNRIYDIHPPHAKILIAAMAKLGGYNGGFSFKNIQTPYNGNTLAFWMRVVPAIVGSLLPISIAYLILLLGASLQAALLGGLIVTLDNALLLQTRIIALDGVLLLSIVISLIFFLSAQRYQDTSKRYIYLLLAGAFSGLATGTKFTGLAAPFLICTGMLIEFSKDRNLSKFIYWLRQGVWVFFGFITVYLFGWYLHFLLLDKPGYADQFVKITGNFFYDLFNLHVSMFNSNANLTATHPDASLFWKWLWMRKAIFYSQFNNSTLYLIGNPVVWYGSTLGLAIILFQSLSDWIRGKKAMESKHIFWVPIVGYLISYLPLWRVTRALFLYHYMTPLLFAWLLILLWADRRGWLKSEALKNQSVYYFCFIVILVVGFIIISPFTYSIEIGPDYRKFLISTFVGP